MDHVCPLSIQRELSFCNSFTHENIDPKEDQADPRFVLLTADIEAAVVLVTNARTQRPRELWTEIRDRSVKEKEGREIPTIFSSPFV